MTTALICTSPLPVARGAMRTVTDSPAPISSTSVSSMEMRPGLSEAKWMRTLTGTPMVLVTDTGRALSSSGMTRRSLMWTLTSPEESAWLIGARAVRTYPSASASLGKDELHAASVRASASMPGPRPVSSS